MVRKLFFFILILFTSLCFAGSKNEELKSKELSRYNFDEIDYNAKSLKFKDPIDAIAKFTDFKTGYKHASRLELISKKPLIIQLIKLDLPIKDDDYELFAYEEFSRFQFSRNQLLDVALRAFIHTDVSSIQLKLIYKIAAPFKGPDGTPIFPGAYDFKNVKHQSKYDLNLKIDRLKMMSILSEHYGADKFEDLIVDITIDNEVMRNLYTEAINELVFKDMDDSFSYKFFGNYSAKSFCKEALSPYCDD